MTGVQTCALPISVCGGGANKGPQLDAGGRAADGRCSMPAGELPTAELSEKFSSSSTKNALFFWQKVISVSTKSPRGLHAAIQFVYVLKFSLQLLRS